MTTNNRNEQACKTLQNLIETINFEILRLDDRDFGLLYDHLSGIKETLKAKQQRLIVAGTK